MHQHAGTATWPAAMDQGRHYAREIGLLGRPFFVALELPTFPLERFRAQQAQFAYAVGHFAQPLALLAGRLPDPGLRDRIVRNLWEEHGQGDAAFWHRETFCRFLERLGLSQEQQRATQPGVAVDAFNTALAGICLTEPVGMTAAALGMIELLFADISAFIAKAVIAHGWLDEADLAHYSLHAHLDTEHAADLFAVADAEAGSMADIARGIRLGAYLFERLYDDLARL